MVIKKNYKFKFIKDNILRKLFLLNKNVLHNMTSHVYHYIYNVKYEIRLRKLYQLYYLLT